MSDVTIFRDVDEILSRMGSLKIESEEEFEEAGEFLNRIALTEKVVKDYYEEDRKAAYDVYQGVLHDIRRFVDPLTKAKSTTKGMMNAYLNSKRVEEADTGVPAPKSSSTVEYTVWSYEVVDLSKVNPKYLMVNDKAVQALVNDMHELAEDTIGGIKVTSEVRVKPKGR